MDSDGTSFRLADSWARLEWVRTLIAQIAPTVNALSIQAKAGPLRVEQRCHGAWMHARVSLHEPLPVPEHLGFVVGDIAVNARSCLDMAITQLNAHFDAAMRRPQFPILDDRANQKNDASMREIRGRLPAVISDAVLELQPVHDAKFGHLDIPLNVEVLFLREVANANKHRNITPVVRAQTMRGVRHSDVAMELLSDGDESPWEPSDAAICEVRYEPTRLLADDEVAHLAFGERELTLARTGAHYGEPKNERAWMEATGFDLQIDLVEFLKLVPRYVGRALRDLERAAAI